MCHAINGAERSRTPPVDGDGQRWRHDLRLKEAMSLQMRLPSRDAVDKEIRFVLTRLYHRRWG